MLPSLIYIILGFLVLLLGGDLLVRGAVRLAERLGVSPLVIGLTLVGFGTSTPELVTSLQAALAGSPGIAFGNIVGSNIANILLIVGSASVIFPIAISANSLRRDGLFMVAVAIVFAVLAALGPIGSGIGAVFLAALAGYILVTFYQERNVSRSGLEPINETSLPRRNAASATVASSAAQAKSGPALLMASGGLTLILIGGYLLVNGATSLARIMDISETVIGLTIVAVGTSLPELVTSVVAAWRRQADVAFGNIVGSNIYNLLGIGGITALVAPSRVPLEIVRFDNWVMVAVSVLLVVVAFTGRRIARWEGGVLIAGYIAYVFTIWPT
jgi:cation:H+ antiporter